MIKTDKKKNYVDSNLVYDIAEEDTSKMDVSNMFNFDAANDVIRYITRNHWYQKNNDIINTNTAHLPREINIIHVNENTIKIVANKKNFSVLRQNKKGVLENTYDKKLWLRYISTNIEPYLNNVFYDHSFEIKELTTLKEIKDASSINGNFINHEFVYNFYHSNYEYIINDLNTDVRIIPSAYYFAGAKNKEKQTFQEQLCLSLGNLLSESDTFAFLNAKTVSDSLKQYYYNLSETIMMPDFNQYISEIIGYNQNYIIEQKDTENISKLNFIPYPFYLTINFSNNSTDLENFIHKIDKIGHVKHDLYNYLVQKNINSSNLKITRQLTSDGDSVIKQDIREEDLIQWINDGLQNITVSPITNKEPSELRQVKTSLVSEYAALISAVKESLKSKKRTFKQILTDTAHSETLIYKIEKRQFSYNSPSVIQTFWIAATKNDIIKFLDTQLKYGTEYFYTIKAVQLVVGNRYKYSLYNYDSEELDKENDIQECSYKLNIANDVSYKIFEIPIANFSGTVVEYPYTKPVVKIEQDRDLVRINLLDSAAETREKFSIIENKDFNVYEKIKNTQENEDPEEIISYNNLDTQTIVEIYKISGYPINYLSFQGKLYKTLTLNNQKAIFDNIMPNMKYYYLFRYLNNHKIPSNVSDVYEVEMKDEDGYKFLNVSKINLTKTYDKNYQKEMKKYLLVRPSLIQTVINVPQDEENIDNVTLGPPSNKVWDQNKKFILRIKSKKSKRILDFNISTLITRKKN